MSKDPKRRESLRIEEAAFFQTHHHVFGKQLKHALESFRLPEEVRLKLKSPHPSEPHCPFTQSAHELKHLFHDGNYFVLNSFYALLLFLQKRKRRFSIVFQTFGNDLALVMTELE